MGRRQGLRVPRGRHQRHPRGLGPRRRRTRGSCRPGTRRWRRSRRSGYAKFTGRVGVCMATSRPGAIHLLNGLYDAKLDHVPVVAIVGQTARSAMGGSYQQEVDLLTLFKDVASDYVQMVTVPEQLPNVLDRAIRIAAAERAPDRGHHPLRRAGARVLAAGARVQDGPVQPGHRLAARSPPTTPRSAAPPTCSTPARRSRCWSARVPAARAAEVEEVADLLGAGVAKALLGKDVLSDELPWVTGSIGLLGTRPSYEMMMGCDTLLTVGSNFPYTQFMPTLDQARGVQIDIDAELHRHALPVRGRTSSATPPRRCGRCSRCSSARPTGLAGRASRRNVGRWWETMRARGAWSRPTRSTRCGCSASCRPALPDDAIVTADSGSSANWYARHLQVPRRHARLAVGHPRHHGPRRALRHRRQVRPPRPAGRSRSPGDGAMQMNGHGRAHHHQALLAAVGRPPAGRGGAAQQRPQPGHLGDAGDGRARRSSPSPRPCPTSTTPASPPASGCRRVARRRARRRSAPAWDAALAADRPTVLDVHTDPDVPPDPAARHVRADEGHGRGAAQGRRGPLGRR